MKEYRRSMAPEERMKVKTFRHFICDKVSNLVPKPELKTLFKQYLESLKSSGKVSFSEDEKYFTYSGKKRKMAQEEESKEAPRQDASPSSAVMNASPAPSGNVSILLFYAYSIPQMSRSEQDAAIAHCYKVLSENNMTGRLRVAREGFNATLTGTRETVRIFTASLRAFAPRTFGSVDFKYVDGLPENQALKGLKVWPVTEIVTYGFNPDDAPLELGGIHLKPQEFHNAMKDPNTVVIDVRNVNGAFPLVFAAIFLIN